jgi:hypothetical protein
VPEFDYFDWRATAKCNVLPHYKMVLNAVCVVFMCSVVVVVTKP